MGEPRERPILFSAPMVRALLDGRKTQTRRVCKVYQSPHGERDEDGWPWRMDAYGDYHREVSPYGQPGDRLWVRETWALENLAEEGERLVWRADREAAWRSSMASRFYLPSDYSPARWRPSIHMPRWASRLTLEVTDVRVERLQAISEDDAWAEGSLAERARSTGTTTADLPSARRAFQRLWESINGPESWKANPWVWVVSFTRVEAAR